MGRCIVEVFSRVTGFFRPVQDWNKGKAEEFKERKKFKIDKGGEDAVRPHSTDSVSGETGQI